MDDSERACAVNIQDCVEELVIRGMRDWVQPHEVVGLIVEFVNLGPGDTLTSCALEVIRILVEQDLFEAGDVTHSGKFVPWGVGAGEAMARIEREWPAGGALPEAGATCWLQLTNKGRRLSDRLWKE